MLWSAASEARQSRPTARSEESGHMHFRRLLALAVVLLAAEAGYWWWSEPQPPQYVTSPATIGSILRTVTSTGSVNPVITVQVGTYVSGTIQSLFCDYNTQVKAGQICAKIDPRPFQVQVDQGKANLASARAQLVKDQASLQYARVTYSRDAGLLKRGIVSQDSVDSDQSNFGQMLAQVEVDKAAIQQRESALEAAQINLDYTDIVSPVDGVVVSRAVNVGQTVAASFQTPTLFLIAKDLTKMQVDTNVSESDVGRRPGAPGADHGSERRHL
jgi:HlyD family secretion protein